ncbi:Ig domain-containing protein, partial [Methylobacterium hispanicum]
MHIRSFLLSVVSVAALVGAAANAQTLAEQIAQQSEGEIQGYGNFFRYRIDGLDPSLYDTPVVKVVQPRKFFIGEKADLTVNVRGGNRPYAFSLIGPALPKGLSFDPRKGNFVGTTKLPGSASYVMAVQDARGRIAQSDPFTVTWLDDFDESQFHAYPVEAFVDGAKLPSPQPIFDGSATTDVATTGFGSTVAVRFDQPVRAKTAVVAFSTEAAGGACSYDLEAKDEDDKWRPVHRASSLASGGVLSAFNLMPTPRSGFVSTDWRVNLTNGCRMRLSELRIASAPPN